MCSVSNWVRDADLKFKVDKAEPVLVNTGQNFLTLDPSASKAVFSVYAINYKKAQPENLRCSTYRLARVQTIPA